MDANELVEILNGYFNWNKARMKCFVGMLIALIKVRTVNLTELACGFSSAAQQDSRYKRIKRFFQGFNIDVMASAAWVISYVGLSGQALQLSMDRTNWLWGKSNINILMLSVVYKGIAIPLLWKLLPKRGNSDTAERVELMQRFITLFGREKISCVLADREFVGDEWFSWLFKEQISFCIRIKNNHVTTNSRGLEVGIEALFYDLKPGEQRVIPGKRKLWKQQVYLSALRLSDGELLLLAADKLLDNPVDLYAKRWEIETLFSCLKGRGFNFEDTHLTQQNRIEKLLFLLTIAFCWAHKTGEWRHEQKHIKIKKHGRLAISYFRYGLDFLRDMFLNGTKCMHNLFDLSFSFQPNPLMEHTS